VPEGEPPASTDSPPTPAPSADDLWAEGAEPPADFNPVAERDRRRRSMLRPGEGPMVVLENVTMRHPGDVGDVRIERKFDAVPGGGGERQLRDRTGDGPLRPPLRRAGQSAVCRRGHRLPGRPPESATHGPAIRRKSAALAVPHRPSTAAYPASHFYMGVPVAPRVCAVAFGFGRERLCKSEVRRLRCLPIRAELARI